MVLTPLIRITCESWEKKYNEDFETYAERVNIDSSGDYFIFGYYGHS